MSRLAGRIAIVTGAGRGIGRAHALTLAAGGASVVVNDVGVAIDGDGADVAPAEAVCEKIRQAGGSAITSNHDISSWEDAAQLIESTVDAFGGLDVLVNNAGILRDRAFSNMSETEWDAVVAVHLKGHAATSRHAMTYWRAEAKAGRRRAASAVHTTSSSGLCGNFGQANYGAAKMGVVGLSKVMSIEGAKYGVRSNVISPSARTRMIEDMTGVEMLGQPDETGYDPFGPEHVAVLVAWLAEADCTANNQVFHVSGRRVRVLEIPRIAFEVTSETSFTPETLAATLEDKLVPPMDAFRLILD